jgi:hypothetical protein
MSSPNPSDINEMRSGSKYDCVLWIERRVWPRHQFNAIHEDDFECDESCNETTNLKNKNKKGTNKHLREREKTKYFKSTGRDRR